MTKRLITILSIIGFAVSVITTTEAMQQTSIPPASGIEQPGVQQSSESAPAESENQQAMTTNYRKQKRRNRGRRRGQFASQPLSLGQQHSEFQQPETMDTKQRVTALEQRILAQEQRLVIVEGQNKLLMPKIQELEATIQKITQFLSRGSGPGHFKRKWKGNWQGQSQDSQTGLPGSDAQSGNIPAGNVAAPTQPAIPTGSSTPVTAVPAQATTSQLMNQQN